MNQVRQDQDLLAEYFAGRLRQHVDQLWQERGLTADDMERWLIDTDHWMAKVTEFEIVGDYTVRVLFDDGAQQVIDFEPVLNGEIWGPLRDLALFNQVAIDPTARTLTWPNGADFDPETLRNWPEYKDELAARAQSGIWRLCRSKATNDGVKQWSNLEVEHGKS